MPTPLPKASPAPRGAASPGGPPTPATAERPRAVREGVDVDVDAGGVDVNAVDMAYTCAAAEEGVAVDVLGEYGDADVGVDEDADAEEENIVVRFPREQVEELVSYLIEQLIAQEGCTEEEAGAKAAEVLDDPEAQLVMAWELNKPTLTRALREFYTSIGREELLENVEEEVDEYSGRTDDLIAALVKRYQPAVPDLEARLAALRGVSHEEREWVAVAERSTTIDSSARQRSGTASSRGGSSEVPLRPAAGARRRIAGRSLSSAASTAAAGSGSTPGVSKEKRFLMRFLRRYDPPASDPLEVDALLAEYAGRHAQLRRRLCDQFADTPAALDALHGMPVEPAAPATAREKWLANNAALARRYYRRGPAATKVLGALDAMYLCTAFNRVATLWLLVACVLAVLFSVHLVVSLGLAAFARTGWAAAGAWCTMVVVACLAGSLFTLLRHSVRGWALHTSMDYYADCDYGARAAAEGERGDAAARKNTPPGHLRHVLPPRRTRTSLNLPTAEWVSRRVYAGVALAALAVAPLVGGAAVAGADGHGLLEFFSAASVTGTAAVGVVLALAWAAGWVAAVRAKAAAIQRRGCAVVGKVLHTCAGDPCCCCCEAGEGSHSPAAAGPAALPWSHDRALLREFGLDATSVARGAVVMAMAVASLSLVFWTQTSSEPLISVPWAFFLFAVLLVFAGLRELFRSSHAAWTPHVVVALAGIFAVVGGVGAAHVSCTALGAYIGLLALAQGLLLRQHSDETTEASESMLRAVERMTSPAAAVYVEDNESTPLRMGEVAKASITADDANAATGSCFDAKRWLPCGTALVNLFTCSARGDLAAAAPSTAARRARVRTAAQAYALRPTASVAQGLDTRLWCCWLVFAVVAALAMFAMGGTFEASAAGYAGETAAGDAGDYTAPLPVCRAPVNGVHITDYALLAKLAYETDATAFEGSFAAWFGGGANATAGGWQHVLPAGVDVAGVLAADYGEGAASREVSWLHFAKGRHHVIAIRTDAAGRLLARDLEVWGTSALWAAAEAAAPVLSWWGVDDATALLRTISGVPDTFRLDDDVLEAVTAFVEELRVGDPAVRVTVVGHGIGGGYARWVAARTATPAVTFNAPGYLLAQRVADAAAAARPPREVAVISADAVLPHLDRQTGAVQVLPCAAGATGTCGSVQATARELLRGCADPRTVASVC